MPARIVETVTGATTAELRLKRGVAETRADIVELRIDGVGDLDLPALLADRVAPVIVTCRPVWEGGRYDGVEPDRLRLLRRARALGAEFIDVEFRADWRSVLHHREPSNPRTPEASEPAEGIILSLHDHAGVPADLETIAAGMEAAGADVVKIAVVPPTLSDCVRLARIGASLRTGAVIGMGPKGLVTRMAPDRFNACWTYTGALSQLGQISPEAARNLFAIGNGSAGARLFGVVGNPVTHSLSPVLHNSAFRHEGIDAVYGAFEAVDFADFERFAREFDVAGVSVTAPFKGAALDASISADAAARATRAANTLKRTPDGWAAANTDVDGFLAPLDRARLEGARAAVIGRGGASRAVSHALAGAGADVTVLGRGDLDRASEPWDLLVNATPVGTDPDTEASVMNGRPVRARHVYDLVYNPRDTRLLRDARAAGAATTGGLDMLVAQACRQFEFWFGRPAPVDAYHAAAERLLSHETDDVRRVR
jgi:3-dehydroquinate dehydratase/shikimate dehydrogenase